MAQPKRIISAALLVAFFTSFKGLFVKALTETPTFWKDLATEVKSTTKMETYAWLGKFPRMREWIGDKVYQQLEAHGYSVLNKSWEASVEVSRDDIEDDNMGLYGPMFTDMGEEGARHYDLLVLQLLTGGFAAKCYDGQYFFDTDHPWAKTTVSNAGTAVLSADAYAAARAKMMNLKDESGVHPLFIRPNLLVVDPANEGTAKLIVENKTLDGGEDNPYYKTATVKVIPGLGTKWYLMDTGRALKPLIMQVRKKPVLVSQTNPESDSVFDRATYKYSVEARHNAGYGLWQLAYGSTGAGEG